MAFLSKFLSVEQRLAVAEKRIGDALDMFDSAVQRLTKENDHLEQVKEEARTKADDVLQKAHERSSKLLTVADTASAHQEKNVRIMGRLKDFLS